jgi:methanogenic corrinoid protein MtbC1
MTFESDGAATDDERLAMLAALVNGDVNLAYRLATDLLAQGVPFDVIVGDVLTPVQTELGRRWAAGDLGVAYEHAASAAVDDLLIRLGATAEAPSGPTVVVASAEQDAHALGGRVVASALALEGFRVLFLGARVPADDLGDFLELQAPLALALSCSIPAILAGAARSVEMAHSLGIPVVGGGRALATDERARRLGVDAFARDPAEAVAILRAWHASPPEQLAAVPPPIPERTTFATRSHAFVSTAIDASANGNRSELVLAEELSRVLQVVESALLVEEPNLVAQHVHWLRDTGPTHGFAPARIDAALTALANAMDADIPRAGRALHEALD